MTPTAESLALEFSQALHAHLSPEQMTEVVLRNRIEASHNICHTHDFCDANMILYDVFMKYGMNPVDEGGLDRWGDLWNRSWNLAKSKEFQTTKYFGPICE